MAARRASLGPALAWAAALASAAGLALAARDAGRALDELPRPAWSGAPLRAAPEPAAAAPEDAPPPAPAAPERVDGALVLDLARLEFGDYDPPELRGDALPLPAAAFPPAVAALDGETVVVEGYVQPLDFEQGRVTRLRLSRFPPGCCFGALPQYDEWLAVALEARGALGYDAWAPLTVRGTLEVGEALDETGAVQSIYRLRGARVE